VNLQEIISQKKFGELVGISQQAVSDLVRREILNSTETAEIWLQNYCAHLREQAAGRAAAGDLDLAGERAALAKVQRERIEMQNAVTRRELAPVALLEIALATVGQKIAAILESIPGNIKRRSKNLTSEDVEIMVAEIAKARNVAATAQLDMEDYDGSNGDTEGDTARAEES
jgi:phage terminase Nu1 subunit (DNA packaging protein)